MEINSVLSDIQYYFEYIIKNLETLTGNPPLKIYINRMDDRMKFNIKIRYSFEFLTPKTIKLVDTSENKIMKINMVKKYKNYKLLTQFQDSKVLFTFVPK